MEKYKKQLKIRMFLMGSVVIFAIILEVCTVFGLFNVTGNDDGYRGLLRGFQSGLLTGIMVIFAFLINHYRAALSNKLKLEKLYNAENDERRLLIKQKSGGNVIIINSVIILLSAIVAGYFNKIVFFSLAACAIFELFVCVSLKIYYRKKM